MKPARNYFEQLRRVEAYCTTKPRTEEEIAAACRVSVPAVRVYLLSLAVHERRLQARIINVGPKKTVTVWEPYTPETSPTHHVDWR